MIDTGIYISYLLLIVALGSAVVLPLVQALKHPKELGKSALGVGALVVVFIVSYALSGSEVTAKYTSMGIGENSSKLIGAGLTMFYIIFILASIGIIVSEINKAIK